jgi:hypothetical protein
MAKLSDADTSAILGANYKAPVETQESLDEQRTTKWTTYRNTAIGIAVVIVIMLLAGYFRT